MGKAKARGNGEGSVYRAAGRVKPWAATLTVGWSLDGKPIRRSRFASSEREARGLLAEMKRTRSAGLALPDAKLSVGKFLARWLDSIEVRPGTRRSYRFHVERFLLPALGSRKLRDLRASHVSEMLADMSGLSSYTAAATRSVLATALRAAERDRLVDHNAASLTRSPRLPAPHLAPEPADVRAALQALAGHRLHALYVVMATTGLRLQEATGLAWTDIDEGELHVRHQLMATRDPAEPFVLTEPKSEASKRTVMIPQLTRDALSVHRDRHAAEAERMGRRWRNLSGLVFTTRDGDPLAPSSVQHVLLMACRRAGVRHISPHDLRRFVATQVEERAGREVAQRLLGHSGPQMTDRYVTTTDPMRRKAAQAIADVLLTTDHHEAIPERELGVRTYHAQANGTGERPSETEQEQG